MNRNHKPNCRTVNDAYVVDGIRPYCVVLGGGGARGLAHLGAVQAVSERRVTINRLVGVSMGALMASLCIIERDPLVARQRVMDLLTSRTGHKIRSTLFAATGAPANASRKWGVRLFRELKKKTKLARVLRSQSLLPSTFLRSLIDSLIPDIDIRDLNTPLQIVAVDLTSGQRIVLNSGSLRRAIRASMSIPGVFPAVRFEDKWLSDIGVFDLVPCNVPPDHRSCVLDNEGTIAVDVGQSANENVECKSALESILRCQTLAEQKLRELSLARADLVIRPILKQTEWFDFTEPEPIIEAGYLAACKALGIPSDEASGKIEIPSSVSHLPLR